jgi:hypothetical protein
MARRVEQLDAVTDGNWDTIAGASGSADAWTIDRWRGLDEGALNAPRCGVFGPVAATVRCFGTNALSCGLAAAEMDPLFDRRMARALASSICCRRADTGIAHSRMDAMIAFASVSGVRKRSSVAEDRSNVNPRW